MNTELAGYTLIALYCSLAFVGLLGNIWVMRTVLSQLISPNWCALNGGIGKHSPNRRSSIRNQQSAYIYLLLLSIVDLISLVPVPLLAVDIIANRWPFGIILCKMLFLCESTNKSLSPLILTALSVDRFIAVCRPTLFWMREWRFACTLLAACVIIATCAFIGPVTMYADVSSMIDMNKHEHYKCTVEMSRVFDFVHTICCYLLPLILICFVYVGILHRLWMHTHSSSVGRRTSISLSRVVKCSVMVVAFYFVCWTPYWIMRFVSNVAASGMCHARWFMFFRI